MLMIMTSDESGLSAPINFESVRSQSLPLSRADNADQVDSIRVSLNTAIRFIADLQRREEEAFPDMRLSATDRSIGSSTDNISFGLISADEWVDEIMHEAEEKGANNVPQVKCVAERMKAEQEGNGYRCQSSLDFPRGGYSLCCGSRWRDDSGGWMVIQSRLLSGWWWGRTDRTPCAALHSC